MGERKQVRTLMLKRTNQARVVGLMCLSFAASIGAQAASAAPGDNVRAGSAEVEPSLGIFGTYRSNVYLQEGTAGGSEPTQPGFSLSAHPAIALRVKSDVAALKLGAGYTARKYLTPGLANLDRFNDVNLSAGLKLLPKAVVGINLTDSFKISGRETELESAEDAYVQRTRNLGQGELAVRPGSAMEIRAGGRFEYDYYQFPTGAGLNADNPSLNSRLGYGPTAGFEWRFLPKTAFQLGFEQVWFYWQDNFLEARGRNLQDGELGAYVGVPDGKRTNVNAAVRGRFTKKIILGLSASYTAMVYDEQSVLDDAANEVVPTEELTTAGFDADLKGLPAGLGGGAELQYIPTEEHKISLGYLRDFQDVYWTNYVGYHTLSFTYEGTFAERVRFVPTAMYRVEDYAGEAVRTDGLIRAGADVYITGADWLEFNLGTLWTGRRTLVGTQQSSVEYDDTSVHAGVIFSY